MKQKTLYTNLSVEECKNIFKERIKQTKEKFFDINQSEFIGDFYNNEFWIAASLMPTLGIWIHKILKGTIVHVNNKSIINLEFGILKNFIMVPLIVIFYLLLFFSFQMKDLREFFIVTGLLGGFFVLSIIVVYYLTYYQYNAMFKFVKEMFQCEEGE